MDQAPCARATGTCDADVRCSDAMLRSDATNLDTTELGPRNNRETSQRQYSVARGACAKAHKPKKQRGTAQTADREHSGDQVATCLCRRPCTNISVDQILLTAMEVSDFNLQNTSTQCNVFIYANRRCKRSKCEMGLYHACFWYLMTSRTNTLDK